MRILIKRSKRNNQWRVYFYAANNKVLMTSELYKNKRDAVATAELVKSSFVDYEIEIEK
jgi:uncharacterized protein YegP (UPF0339 family)